VGWSMAEGEVDRRPFWFQSLRGFGVGWSVTGAGFVFGLSGFNP
jgi:hypothetical protein